MSNLKESMKMSNLENSMKIRIVQILSYIAHGDIDQLVTEIGANFDIKFNFNKTIEINENNFTIVLMMFDNSVLTISQNEDVDMTLSYYENGTGTDWIFSITDDFLEIFRNSTILYDELLRILNLKLNDYIEEKPFFTVAL